MVGRYHFSIIHMIYCLSGSVCLTHKGRSPAWLTLPSASLLLCHPTDSSQSKCWQRAPVTPCVVACSCIQHLQTADSVTDVFHRIRTSLPCEKKQRFRDSWGYTVNKRHFWKPSLLEKLLDIKTTNPVYNSNAEKSLRCPLQESPGSQEHILSYVNITRHLVTQQ